MMNKKFIKATEKACSFEEHVPAPYVRRSFDMDFVPEKAQISICGLGFYLLYINGKEITKGELAPYISNPDHFCYYDTYDVREYLTEGENVIGIILGNGFFNAFGGAIWDFEKAEWLGAPRMSLEFFAENKEKRIEFIADEKFRVHSSPIIFDELRMGEYYNANLEIKGWNEQGFDDSDWDYAIKAETPRGELRLCSAEPIRTIKTIKPQKILKCSGGYIYDFGENTAGVCMLKIKAQKNQKIEMLYGELLKDGELDRSSVGFNRPGFEYYKQYNHKDIYIAKGEGTESYIPRFVYHGFRYAAVYGITEQQATEELLTYNVMSSDFKTLAEFSCSDETVNKLYEMTVRSDRANFYYFPTDCPHREKNGWTGDASMSADHMAIMYDVSASWHEWLNNIRKSQTAEGALPGIVPTDTWGYEWGNGPAWDSVLFNLPYALYRCRKDLAVIKENASAMIRYLEYIIGRRSADGTIAVGLGDWVPVGKPCDGYSVPLAFTDSLMVMDMARKAEEMFEAVGYTHHKNFAGDIYTDMRSTIRRELIDFQTMTVKGNCQSGQALALYYGVFEESERKRAFDKLLEFIHEKNDSFDCGFLGMHTIFHVLSDFGEDELAYHMITKKEYPSYGHLIEKGETALVEAFQPDGKGCGSHNHHFLGDISRWFINRLAGLCVVNSENVKIMPCFIDELNSAAASVELPKGKVSVSWQRKEDEIKLDVECCSEIKYEIVLPDGYIFKGGAIKKID
jgi:alpha-L-rhamnosidase